MRIFPVRLLIAATTVALAGAVLAAPTGTITFRRADGVYTVPASGGTPKRIRAVVLDDSPVEDPKSVSLDGQVEAWSTLREVKVSGKGGANARTLASSGKPQALFAALRSAKRPERLKDVMNVDPALYGSSNNWAFSTPAITPDGKTVFFATNLGQGMGASGNTSFCWFAADVATGKLSVLSKLGTFFGRVPWYTAVSPDGLRMYFVVSEHSSAVENPCFLYVVDLLTQTQREALHNDPKRKNQVNIVDGASWSPDSRYIAIGTMWYDVEGAWKKPDWQPTPRDFSLQIVDAATAKTVRTLPNGVDPLWKR